MHSSGEILGQRGEHARRVLGPDLREHHRDGLRVFVLQIVGEHRLVHVAELVPHGAAGRAADLLHQAVDLFLRQNGGEHALGLFERAHDRARARHARRRTRCTTASTTADGHDAERGHRLGDFLDLLFVQRRPKLLGFFAEAISTIAAFSAPV